MLKAHRLKMEGLIPENGRFRSGNVGVFEGDKLIHLAPPAIRAPMLISDLLKWYVLSEYHPLVKSAVFHFEFEFIHPFADGNGRIGRMWHTLLLAKRRELFYWLPIEDLIKQRQKDYYASLALSSSTPFVSLMLQIILDSLKSLEADGRMLQASDQVSDQDDAMGKLLIVLGNEALSASEIMERLGLSHRASFRERHLDPALKKGLIERTISDKPNSRNQKYRKKRKA